MRRRVGIDSLFIRVADAYTDSILLLFVSYSRCFTSEYSFSFLWIRVFCHILKDCTKHSLTADLLRLWSVVGLFPFFSSSLVLHWFIMGLSTEVQQVYVSVWYTSSFSSQRDCHYFVTVFVTQLMANVGNKFEAGVCIGVDKDFRLIVASCNRWGRRRFSIPKRLWWCKQVVELS